MADVVLIHGAFRGGWAWERVAPLLEAAGHRCFSPTLSSSAGSTLDDWASEIVDLVETNAIASAVLVGHSQGGIVAQAAAEKMPDRMERIIFLDAPILRDGEAAIDVFPPEIRAQMPPISPDAMIAAVAASANEHMTADDARWINERLTSQPARPGFERINLKSSANVPHSYIFCRHTPPFFPASYTRTRFDREGVAYTLIDAPHDCIITDPETVAVALNQILCKMS